MSLTPPREDQEPVAALYPSYWLLSVLNLTAPFSTTPVPGLPAVSPTGIIRAERASTFATFPEAGCRTKLFPAVDVIVFSVILILSLTFNVANVFILPEVWTSPEVDSTLNKFPTLRLSELIVASYPVELIANAAFELIVFNAATDPLIKLAFNCVGIVNVSISPVVESISSVVIFLWLISIAAAVVDKTSVKVTLKPDPKVFGLFGSIVTCGSLFSLPPISGCTAQ